MTVRLRCSAGVASLDEAGPEELAFFACSGAKDELYSATRAGAVLVAEAEHVRAGA